MSNFRAEDRGAREFALHYGTMVPRSVRHLARASLAPGILALGIGCGADFGVSEPPPESATSGIEFQGIVFQGRFLVEEPDNVITRVTMRNPDDEPHTVRFADTCRILLRAYFPDGSRIWDMRDVRKGCRDRVVPTELDPGEELDFLLQATSLSILGLDLPAGTYEITAYFQPADADEVEFLIGETFLELPEGLFENR